MRTDVERVLGGSGDDTLTGTSGQRGAGRRRRRRHAAGHRAAPTRWSAAPAATWPTTPRARARSSITLDDAPGDGEPGEGDDVAQRRRARLRRIGGRHARGLGRRRRAATATSGDDTFRGGAGADKFTGDGGDDTIDYSDHPAGVTADADGVADDGTTGANERDNVGTDVDNFTGGDGPDRLTGTTYPTRSAAAGATTSCAAATTADTLVGGEGNDDLGGDSGDDTLDGGSGGDRVSGGTRHRHRRLLRAAAAAST